MQRDHVVCRLTEILIFMIRNRTGVTHNINIQAIGSILNDVIIINSCVLEVSLPRSGNFCSYRQQNSGKLETESEQ